MARVNISTDSTLNLILVRTCSSREHVCIGAEQNVEIYVVERHDTVVNCIGTSNNLEERAS